MPACLTRVCFCRRLWNALCSFCRNGDQEVEGEERRPLLQEAQALVVDDCVPVSSAGAIDGAQIRGRGPPPAPPLRKSYYGSMDTRGSDSPNGPSHSVDHFPVLWEEVNNPGTDCNGSAPEGRACYSGEECRIPVRENFSFETLLRSPFPQDMSIFERTKDSSVCKEVSCPQMACNSPASSEVNIFETQHSSPTSEEIITIEPSNITPASKEVSTAETSVSTPAYGNVNIFETPNLSPPSKDVSKLETSNSTGTSASEDVSNLEISDSTPSHEEISIFEEANNSCKSETNLEIQQSNSVQEEIDVFENSIPVCEEVRCAETTRNSFSPDEDIHSDALDNTLDSECGSFETEEPGALATDGVGASATADASSQLPQGQDPVSVETPPSCSCDWCCPRSEGRLPRPRFDFMTYKNFLEAIRENAKQQN